MSKRANKPATYEDLEALPPYQVGESLGEPELHFGSDVLVPDLAGWRRERLKC